MNRVVRIIRDGINVVLRSPICEACGCLLDLKVRADAAIPDAVRRTIGRAWSAKLDCPLGRWPVVAKASGPADTARARLTVCANCEHRREVEPADAPGPPVPDSAAQGCGGCPQHGVPGRAAHDS